MKKLVLISSLLLLGGCKESNTGLDKNVFNTSYDKCVEYLTNSLKSPSSLKIREANISTIIPPAEDINSVFGDIIAKDGLIKSSIKDEKARFRELTVDIDYEAHNSYGASIRGYYQCGYIYSLKNNETIPKPLNTYLYKLKSDGEVLDLGVHVPFAEFSGSNFYLNKVIKRIVGAKDSQFNEIDKNRYEEIEAIYRNKKQDIEAEKLRESWDKAMPSVEVAAAAAAADIAAAASESER
ncbi:MULTISPECIES: hypothetical protein [Acinetobacter calcoaceticus/baumannii complex]|uniref:hypothetical protein n=1 Tax=Acinetobacter calcoaceticus/baumannii complex TaxID=909768 RepID=UPI00044E54DA|nr:MULTISPECIES: hypothetical protein [Acinetobacter calcoaceticus/baumannii complex]EXB42574.1 putative lipoprotein [Acinetobacter baumannii 1440422]MCT9373729.1 hypothetical protein [Acinetobacter baumannii]MDA3524074.1 hypothetical protein [Acinetobacter baumannii]MDA3529647.1 hypothetical protein [Acinetobacter baumannii]MDA4864863.1 hypothetical protein [Acinetobacter baumannii]